MKPSQEHYDVARALSAALEPLIDVCLAIGITSPEIESLMRVAFVQRAFAKLPRHVNTGRGPSDTRVSLAAGVHRSEVSKIRAAGGTTSGALFLTVTVMLINLETEDAIRSHRRQHVFAVLEHLVGLDAVQSPLQPGHGEMQSL